MIESCTPAAFNCPRTSGVVSVCPSVRAGNASREFLLQGPISAFVGTTGIGTSFEDIPLVEDLGSGTC